MNFYLSHKLLTFFKRVLYANELLHFCRKVQPQKPVTELLINWSHSVTF